MSLSFENTVIDKNEKILKAIINAKRAAYEKVPQIISQKTAEEPFEYIISVSTLEPRKNFLSLIRAWEKVRYSQNVPLKLIIVGSPGWKYEPILAAMRPHILSGNIIHLEKVSVFELATLYTHARAFIFPTYYEGFGITPIEAMHAGCPVVVSDTPTTRWVLGNAALYCDPYDISSISDAIIKLLYSDESKSLSTDLLNKARIIIEKYSTTNVAAQWLDVFDQIKSHKIK